MPKAILVPLNGSPLDERALRYATSLAGASGAPLHLVRAIPSVSPTHLSGAEALSLALAQQSSNRLSAKGALGRMATRLRRQGLVVHTHVRVGPPAQVILEASRGNRIGLIVLASRGTRGVGRWWEGSVADEVVRRAEVPVFLVRAGHARGWPHARRPRLLVALDGSALSESVLDPVGELAPLVGAELLLARIVAPPGPVAAALALRAGADPADADLASADAYLRDVAARLPGPGRARTRVATGATPAEGLAQIAREERVDLVALATRGRGGLARLALGSVASALLERSPVPLLLVRPAGTGVPGASVDGASTRRLGEDEVASDTGAPASKGGAAKPPPGAGDPSPGSRPVAL